MAAAGTSEVVREVCEDLEAGLQPELALTIFIRRRPASIFRVPSFFRSRNIEIDCRPGYVSIGPYHYDGSDDRMRGIKMHALADLLGRSGQPFPELRRKYAAIAFRLLPNVKEMYEDGVDLTDSAWVLMLVIDGCFIIDFLVRFYLNDPSLKTDAKKFELQALRTDLLMVENQLPFFILQEFFRASTIRQLPDDVGLMELALVYLSGERVGARSAVEEYYGNSEYNSVTFLHLLHLYHFMCLEPDFAKRVNDPPSIRTLFAKMQSGGSLWLSVLIVLNLTRACLRAVLRAMFWLLSNIWWLIVFRLLILLAVNFGLIRHVTRRSIRSMNLSAGIPNARYLRDTGFTFRRKEAMSSFSCVSRKGNTIEIPALSLDFTTPHMLANLVVFDQACTDLNNNNRHSVAGLVKLLDYLIHTEDDVAILREHDIIDARFGGNEEVARNFSTFCQGFHLNDDHYLNSMFADVRDYYDHNYHRVRFYQWRKKLIPDYFSNPWAVPSMIAAVIGLGLTSASTFYAIYHYYHLRS